MAEHGDKPKPKARVVQIPLASPEVLAEASDFTNWCREFLGTLPGQGLIGPDFSRVAAHLDLKPVAVAFLGPLKHWNLMTFGDRERSRVFDPQIGLNTVDNKFITRVWVFDVFGNEQTFQDPTELSRINYEVPEYNLQGIGRVQTDPVNCGPLCLWAAKRALGQTTSALSA